MSVVRATHDAVTDAAGSLMDWLGAKARATGDRGTAAAISGDADEPNGSTIKQEGPVGDGPPPMRFTVPRGLDAKPAGPRRPSPQAAPLPKVLPPPSPPARTEPSATPPPPHPIPNLKVAAPRIDRPSPAQPVQPPPDRRATSSVGVKDRRVESRSVGASPDEVEYVARIFSALNTARAKVASPDGFYELLLHYDSELFRVLHRYGYLGSRRNSQAGIKDLDDTYNGWLNLQATRAVPNTGLRSPTAPADRSVEEMWATAGSDPIAAAYMVMGYLFSEFLGRRLGIEQDPRRASAGGQITSQIVHGVAEFRGRESLGISVGPKQTIRDWRRFTPEVPRAQQGKQEEV